MLTAECSTELCNNKQRDLCVRYLLSNPAGSHSFLFSSPTPRGQCVSIMFTSTWVQTMGSLISRSRTERKLKPGHLFPCDICAKVNLLLRCWFSSSSPSSGILQAVTPFGLGVINSWAAKNPRDAVPSLTVLLHHNFLSSFSINKTSFNCPISRVPSVFY